MALGLNMENLTVGLGILIGLVWSRRTGWSCGGVITPGLLALYIDSPQRAALTLVLGVILTAPLSFVTRAFGLYGKERTGAAMLLALGTRMGLAILAPLSWPLLHLQWIGWIIPGLIAADADRQGIAMTLCGVISCSLVTAFCVAALRHLGLGS